jgi:hypothetical protein
MKSTRYLLQVFVLFALYGSAQGGNFRIAGRYPVGDDPFDIAAGDFNGDGKLDLVTGDASLPGVSVLLNNGDGTFQPAVNYPMGGYISSVAVGDFNNDGKLDLAVVDLYGDVIDILLGKGDGTFPGPPLVACADCFAFSATAAEMNGDGQLDLVVSGGNFVGGLVIILLGNGDGTFTRFEDLSVGGFNHFVREVRIDDFNHDGVLDLAVSQTFSDFPDGYIGVFLGNPDGTFGKMSVFGHVGYLLNFAIGDVNGDGNDDIVLPDRHSRGGKIFLGAGDGTFPTHLAYETGQSHGGFAVLSDFDGDGILDMAATGFYGVSILTGVGDGTFKVAGRRFIGNGPVVMVAADLDGDHAPDIAVTTYRRDGVTVLLNQP